MTERLENVETGPPASQPVRTLRAVADEVEAQFAVGRFPIGVNLADWRQNAVLDQLEVIHEIFDIRIDTLLRRQADAPVVDLNRPFGQIFKRLFDNAQTLTYLFDAYQIAIVHIASLAN